MTVEKFIFDHWESVPALSLRAGDLARVNGNVLIVAKTPKRIEGSIHIAADPYNDQPLHVMFGQPGQDHICMAMDYTNSSLHTFDDGTGILGDFESGFFYSPRLSLDELEVFCASHINIYKSFFTEHETNLDDGESISMSRFW